VSGQFYDNRTGLVKLADVAVSISEARIGRVSRAVEVTEAGAEVELAITREGPWVEVRVPRLGPHGMVVLEH
jgi:hypothetical protein